jgi:hypothetical protein
MYWARLHTADRFARFAVLALLCDRACPKPFFQAFVGKNDPHIRVLAGFMGSGWHKIRG